MPQIVGATIFAVLGITDVILPIIGSAATLVGQIVLTAVFVGLAIALRPTPPKPADGLQATRVDIPGMIYGFGRARVGGNYALHESKGPSSIDVIALLAGRVRGFVAFYLHNDRVLLSDTSSDPTDPGKEVQNALDATDGRYVDHVHIDWRYGNVPETAYAYPVAQLPSVWSANHRGDATASLFLLCEGASAESFPEVYPRGLPVPSVVLDMPLVWDPRDEDQDPDDPETWGDYPAWDQYTSFAAGDRVTFTPDEDGDGAVYYSRINANVGNQPDGAPAQWCRVDSNPVLILIFLITDARVGYGLSRARLITPVLSNLIAQANICDELVQLKSLDYEPRYTCNCFFTLNTEPEKVLGNVLATCDGWMTEDGDGSLSLTVGKYEAPPEIVLDGAVITKFAPRFGDYDENAVNDLDFRFTSIPMKYKEAPGQSFRDEADIAVRGYRRGQTVDLTWVQSHPQGRRLTKRALAKINAPVRGLMETTLYGLAVLGRRWVRVSDPDIDGCQDMVVEITKCRREITKGKITWEWVKINPNEIDAWDADEEEGTPPTNPADAPEDALPVIEGLRIDLAGEDATGRTAIVSFEDPNRSDLTYRIRFRDATDPGDPGPWSPDLELNEPTSDGARVSTQTTALPLGTVFIFQVAAVGSRGTKGEWSEAVLFSTDGNVITANDGLQITDNAGDFIADNG